MNTVVNNEAPESRRRPALLIVTTITAIAAIAYATYWAVVLRHYESTDNAYVQAPLVQITPQVGGTVIAVLADDTDHVKAGQPLVKLDPADARLALARAEAQLAQTVREVRTLYANNGSLQANVDLRKAEVQRAQAEIARVESDVARAQQDVERRRPLVATGAVGGEEMKHAEMTLASARSALAGARSALTAAQSAAAAAAEQATSNRALTEGTDVAHHPNVQRAAEAVREAFLNLRRCELLAPVEGEVARRSVQVGQRIAAGTPLMSIVPLDQVWVDANFKEVQLREMRLGQPVTLSADLYGGKVEYRGKIAGFGAGTGAAFALLPAQNATGNWIKVVQRVPVRIELDAKDLAAHPLRVGLSMESKVDIGDTSGKPLAAAAEVSQRPSSSTTVFAGDQAAANQRVDEIIRNNLAQRVAAK
ncbi:MAG: HlyD family efflux transporter periplasmic adaptor subunit [Burkholderiales bacterium]|nr:HlyD family efflux transporter periplasmic adaptor subunit [Burkholderiales bacterium]